ncbi:hypothetical protein CCHR01_13429 [Colletotrichum chrysophilum]|uniref:Uncharacterized protein n=1 Tax=Colletotrichum chrysophilum TaxID=1836956 RepID=A0AAD9A9G8_9PEZI|nr:hypothetical protein CCHR01_13429 [Colletotrichum chrysophilum]
MDEARLSTQLTDDWWWTDGLLHMLGVGRTSALGAYTSSGIISVRPSIGVALRRLFAGGVIVREDQAASGQRAVGGRVLGPLGVVQQPGSTKINTSCLTA